MTPSDAFMRSLLGEVFNMGVNNSLQETARRLHCGQASLEETLLWMMRYGSAVSLTWGEDTGNWECSWITGGERFTGVRFDLRLAALEALNKCFAAEVGP